MITKKKFVPKIYPEDLAVNKVWYINYYVYKDNGKPIRKRCYGGLNKIKTIEDRTKKALELCKELENEIFAPIQKKERLNQLDLYYKSKTSVEPKTLNTYKKHINDWVLFLDKKDYLTANKTDVTNYLGYLKLNKYASKSIKSRLNNIKSFYLYLVSNDIITKNPFTPLPKIVVSSQSLNFFNDFQIQKIKEFCLHQNYHQLWFACELQYYCFIRPKELRLLKAENFNLSLNTIEVPGTISKNKKTQKVLIPEVFLKKVQFVESLNPDDYIFTIKNEVVKRDYLSKLHKKVLTELGIKGRYGFYSWKHTGAVKAIQAGINIKELQMQLRHHSLDMVNEYLKNLGILDAEGIKHKFPII